MKFNKPSKQILTLTDNAVEHFGKLLAKEEAGTNIRIDVTKPLTQQAELDLTFCPPGAEQEDDLAQSYNNFTLYLAKNGQQALCEAVIDFIDDQFGGQLSIKAPYIKGMPPTLDSPLAQRVEYLLNAEINPALAQHGGRVSLVEVSADGVVILKFGGGCHGCGMVDVTLKQGIETTLRRAIPEVKEIRDITDHDSGVNPYYK